MRFFVEISYRGTAYSGWQIQPNASSIQSEIESAFSKLFRRNIPIVGCGRTDAGVHASQYWFHVDLNEEIDRDLVVFKLNKMLTNNIAIHKMCVVDEGKHARFDANYRKYIYQLSATKQPFGPDLTYHFPSFKRLEFAKMNEAAQCLLHFAHFYTFCKSNSDVKNYRCALFESYWEFDSDKQKANYHIAANRFLRGMVRMIVGMCINVGLGKLHVEELKAALSNQKRLNKPYSVPPQGLYLCEVRYPFPLI